LGNSAKYVEAVLLIVIAIVGFSLYYYEAGRYLDPVMPNNVELKVRPNIQLFYNVTENVAVNNTLASAWMQYFMNVVPYNSSYDVIGVEIVNYGGNKSLLSSSLQGTGNFFINATMNPFIANVSLLDQLPKSVLYNDSNVIPVAVLNQSFISTINNITYHVTYLSYYDQSSGILVYHFTQISYKVGNTIETLNQTYVLQSYSLVGRKGLYLNQGLLSFSLILLGLVVALSLVGVAIRAFM
jgi:hypothetical protein